MMGAPEVWLIAYIVGLISLVVSRFRERAVGWVMIADVTFLVDMYYSWVIPFEGTTAPNAILFMLSLIAFVISLYKTVMIVWGMLK